MKNRRRDLTHDTSGLIDEAKYARASTVYSDRVSAAAMAARLALEIVDLLHVAGAVERRLDNVS